jgi:flagella basal body P-ring formation protein FlgA
MGRMQKILFAALALAALARPAAAATPGEKLSTSAREALTAAIVEQAGMPGAEVFVSGVRIQDAARATAGGDVLRVALDGGVRSGRGVMFGLFVRDAGGEVRELRASADVSVRVPVVVASRNVPTGAVLGAEDLSVRMREYTSASEAMVGDVGDAVGKRVRWQLSGGVPVRREYLEDPQSLKRGDSVVIEAEAGVVRITGKGVALQSGRVGDMVLVKNQLSGREISGRLTPGHVVRID